MEKLCGHCGLPFPCYSTDRDRCWCRNVPLDEGQLAWIAEKYGDCLCPGCLDQFTEEPSHWR